MHLFSRSLHMAGPPAEVTAHALAVRAHVSNRLGNEVSLWGVLFGAPMGTMSYTARVDGIAGVQAMGAALAGDADLAALVAKGAAWSTGSPVDSLRESLSGEMPGGRPSVGSGATITTAVVSGGDYAAAVGWSLEVAALVEQATGMPVNVSIDMFGTMGQLAWIGIAPNAAAADAANAKITADAADMAKLATAGDMFVPGSAHRRLSVRLG